MSNLKSSLCPRAGLLRVACLIIVLSSGCATSRGPAKPDGAFPETVGKYKLANVEDERDTQYQNEKNKGQSYQSWRAKYSDGSNDIFYQVGVHKSAEAAANELGSLTGCYGSDRKLKTGNRVWERLPLKDKSGKDVGAMAVCFSDMPANPYGDKGLGDYQYAFALSNENRTYTVKPRSDDPALVAEFVKALPFNAGADLSALDKSAGAKAGKQTSYKEMFDTLPPVKLAAKPYLKEKVLVLDRDATKSEQSLSVINATDYYIADPNRHALLANDVGSIVRVDCKRGRRVGTYTADEGDAIPTYASTCEVMVIDNAVPAVIAKKTFTNENMADIQLVDADKKGKLPFKEYVLPKPLSEVKEFVKALPAN